MQPLYPLPNLGLPSNYFYRTISDKAFDNTKYQYNTCLKISSKFIHNHAAHTLHGPFKPSGASRPDHRQSPRTQTRRKTPGLPKKRKPATRIFESRSKLKHGLTITSGSFRSTHNTRYPLWWTTMGSSYGTATLSTPT